MLFVTGNPLVSNPLALRLKRYWPLGMFVVSRVTVMVALPVMLDTTLLAASVKTASAPTGRPVTVKSALVAPFTKLIWLVKLVELVELTGTVTRTCVP